MTQQTINIGSAPNDGTGDPTRSAFDKCNLNFAELYQVSRPTGNAIEYQFNNTTTEPPSTGQIRFNNATQASTTKMWVSHTTSSGVNIKQFLAVATAGAKLVLQDKIDNTNYIKFDVTGAPVDKTTYWEFAVAVTASGGNLPNAAILATVTAGAGSIGAAPYDAQAYNGMQINGSMEVSQELGTGGRTTTGYVCDGWMINIGGTMAVTAAQNPAALFGGGLTPGQIFATVSTAQASLGATDQVGFLQRLEGYRISRLSWGTANAQPITIGFWTSHHRTGLYSGAVANSANTRSYVFTYTQIAADVAQYNTITIPGDTTGTWNKDSSVGLYVYFTMAVGSTYTTATPNVWQAGIFLAATGQVNAVAATSDAFRLSGVVVLPGTQAPTAAQSPLIMRPYAQELITCKRYWHKGSGRIISGYNTAGASIYLDVLFPVEMRVSPTIAYSNASPSNTNSIGINRQTVNNLVVQILIVATGAGYCVFDYTADARF